MLEADFIPVNAKGIGMSPAGLGWWLGRRFTTWPFILEDPTLKCG
jgi:hypothetical protein